MLKTFKKSILEFLGKKSNYASEYRHMGKRYVLYIKANSFDEADQIIEHAYKTGDISAIDFADSKYTREEKLLRIRDSYYNGETTQCVLSITFKGI